MRMPRRLGPIHFVGIGGIGMSGVAEILLAQGYAVQGTDAADGANLKRLAEKGARVHVGHDAKWLGEAAVVVVSSAIKRDNPELMAARARRLPVVRRAEMLAELMRDKRCIAVAGTHGKTTTTSLVATLLDAGDLDPTVVNGGIINAYGTNARPGAGEWMVVEADESDGTFLKLPAEVAIVTNVDPEHLDHFGDFDGDEEGLSRLHRKSAFLWLRGHLRRSSDRARDHRARSRIAASSPMARARRPRRGCSISIFGRRRAFLRAAARSRYRRGDAARRSAAAGGGAS